MGSRNGITDPSYMRFEIDGKVLIFTFEQLFIEMTNRYNLNCRHCGSECDPQKSSFINTDLIIKTIKEVSEVSSTNTMSQTNIIRTHGGGTNSAIHFR